MRTPVLVAWQGGPKAKELSLLSENERVSIALQSLSRMTKVPLAEIRHQLRAWATHNWTRDPYSLGAYSYITVDGMPKIRRFEKPFADTIWFAGEAAAQGSARGTVHGAIHSGLSAANQILQSRGSGLA